MGCVLSKSSEKVSLQGSLSQASSDSSPFEHLSKHAQTEAPAKGAQSWPTASAASTASSKSASSKSASSKSASCKSASYKTASSKNSAKDESQKKRGRRARALRTFMGESRAEAADSSCKEKKTRRTLTTSSSQARRFRREWIDGEHRDSSLHDCWGPSDKARIALVLKKLNAADGMLNKDQVRTMLNRAVGCIDTMLFDKIFALFDVHENDQVDKADFVIALSFLSQQGSARNAVDLAFRLFDVDCNGALSRAEFNSMVTAIMCNRLKHALDTPYGRDAFRTHMENEWSLESIKFWESVTRICDLYEPQLQADAADIPPAPEDGIPVSVARQLFDQYICENAPDQINIAGNTQQAISEELSRAAECGEPAVPVHIFRQAAEEIMQLMEMDNFERFRNRLASETERVRLGEAPKVDYAEDAWTALGLGEDDLMSRDLFRVWARDNPSYFYFLEEIREALQPLFTDTGAMDAHVISDVDLLCDVDIKDPGVASAATPAALTAAAAPLDPGAATSASGADVPSNRKESRDSVVSSGETVNAVGKVDDELPTDSGSSAEDTDSTDRNEDDSDELMPGDVLVSQAASEPLSEGGATDLKRSASNVSWKSQTKTGAVAMPKRLYQRHGTSLVSMRTALDSDGRQVRVFTIDSGAASRSTGSASPLGPMPFTAPSRTPPPMTLPPLEAGAHKTESPKLVAPSHTVSAPGALGGKPVTTAPLRETCVHKVQEADEFADSKVWDKTAVQFRSSRLNFLL